MTLTERINQANTASDAITLLKKGRLQVLPNLTTITHEIEQSKHKVMDITKRPDKQIVVNYVDPITGEIDETKNKVDYVKVNRVTTSMQRLIVERAVSFLFGNDVIYTTDAEDQAGKDTLMAVKRVLLDNSERSHNRALAREVFSYTESAELWYVTEGELHNKYGKPTRYRIRTAQFKPSEGDVLYPFFNANKDLIAFSREFTAKDEEGHEHSYFETYTPDTHYLWIADNGAGWSLVEGYPEQIIIGKIPIVYVSQPQTEWHDVQTKIDRLEELLSNFGDTNDYHAAPKLFVTGDIHGWAKKGESGQVIEGEAGATAQYISWSQAPTSVDTEKQTLLNLIYTETQTPDISFDTLRSISAPSGIALKFMFMDAHLKVQAKMESFGPALRRRVAIIKGLLAQIGIITENDALSTVIDAEVEPYSILDESSDISTMSAAIGNKPVMSRKTAVQRLGYVDDVDSELQRIEEEESANAGTQDLMNMGY